MSTPRIDEGSLLAYLDNAVSPEVRDQIESDPELVAQAQRLRSVESKLGQTLARAICPSATVLGDYQDGLLDTDESLRVARHAAECPHCNRELIQMAAFMDEVRRDIDPGLLERMKHIVADLIRGPSPDSIIPPAARLAPVGIRGAENDRNWIYQAGDYQIAITAAHDSEVPGRFILTGLVIGPDTEHWRAELSSSEDSHTLARIAPVDEIGGFALLGVPHGRYNLRLVGRSMLHDVHGIVI